MIVNRTILLVDDDREVPLGLEESLPRRAESVAVLRAEDGMEALQILKHQPISLVVSELQLPGMDGFGLLAAVTGSYPDIPVVIVSDDSAPDTEQLARQGGAAGYIVKPFPIEALTDQILSLLQKENEGGILHAVASGTFLQLVEMEQKTCTVRLADQISGKRGALFFIEGALCDARQGELHGKAAAYEIFSWDPVSLWIQNDSVVRENRIQKDVHLLVLEAARRRDEHQAPAASSGRGSGPGRESSAADPLDLLRRRIEKRGGLRGGVERFLTDPLWEERIQRLSRHGRQLNLGRLLAGYVDQGDPHGYMLVGGETPAVIVVNRRCPRDQLIRILAGQD